MSYAFYDVQNAAAGGNQVQQSPEERQMAKVRKMIKAAEETNYDGDTEYYQQIKAIALQAGIPIKQFKTNPFRIAKAGLLSALDTMSFGLVPNSLYTPMNTAEEAASSIGGIAGMIAPWGGPGIAARGIMGGVKALPRMLRAGVKKNMSAADYRNLANKGGVGKWWKNRGNEAVGTAGTKKQSQFMSGSAPKVTPKVPTKPLPKQVRVSRSAKTPGAPMASDEALVMANMKPGQLRYYKTIKDNKKQIEYLNKVLKDLAVVT